MSRRVPSGRATEDLPPEDPSQEAFDDERDEDEPAQADEAPEIDFDFEPGAVEAGTEVIRRFWTTLPSGPGVYRMFDAKGDVLYVGNWSITTSGTSPAAPVTIEPAPGSTSMPVLSGNGGLVGGCTTAGRRTGGRRRRRSR